jgi:hypothetical protein
VECLAAGEDATQEAQSLLTEVAEEAHRPEFLGNPTMAYAYCVVYYFAHPLARHSLCEIFRQIVGMTPDAEDSERAWQCQLLRDIFGNPFRPITFLPEWRTSTVVALAQQMYESRDFTAMPILADALMDARCADEAILTHCRGPGPHVRGCWCVDACVGKS